jgi:hypothetical protein
MPRAGGMCTLYVQPICALDFKLVVVWQWADVLSKLCLVKTCMSCAHVSRLITCIHPSISTSSWPRIWRIGLLNLGTTMMYHGWYHIPFTDRLVEDELWSQCQFPNSERWTFMTFIPLRGLRIRIRHKVGLSFLMLLYIVCCIVSVVYLYKQNTLACMLRAVVSGRWDMADRHGHVLCTNGHIASVETKRAIERDKYVTYS